MSEPESPYICTDEEDARYARLLVRAWDEVMKHAPEHLKRRSDALLRLARSDDRRGD